MDVTVAGEYKLTYRVSYPETDARLATVVDGKALPDVVAKAVPGTYMTQADSVCFPLTIGKHTITFTGKRLPSAIGASGLLVSGDHVR